MKKIFSLLAFTCIFNLAFADSTVWQGKVSSDGSPTKSIKLVLGQKYKVKANGKINLGKWRSGGHALENDACFEFIADSNHVEFPPKKLETLKNSLNIDICGGKFHDDHSYESLPFKAVQNGIHFWIYDIDYEDNSGDLNVEVIQVNEESEGIKQP